jgi:DNA-binding XRE family transcriptional regulator
MLTSDRSAQDILDDPPVRAFARSVKRLSQADFDEWLDLVRHLHRADDQEEYDSWIRAIEELLAPRPTGTEPFPLEDEPMPPGLKRWVEHVGGKIRELRTGAGMTQADLALAAGISPDYIRRLEDLEHPASHLALTRIARALGLNVGEIDPCTA